MAHRTLIIAARETEDVATGLRVFRDALPHEGTSITSIISKLYDISSLFTRLERASLHPQYEPSFFRIKDEVLHVVLSSRATSKMALDMFDRTITMSLSRVWDDLNYRMAEAEAMSFHQRLDLYRDLLGSCVALLKEQPCQDIDILYARISELWQAQQSCRSPHAQSSDYQFGGVPLSPLSDGHRHAFAVPEPPPLSPTWTNSSGQTYQSSQTSYSAAAPPVHWAREVFDGVYPGTRFGKAFESRDATRCEGVPMPDALERLAQEDFTRALELQFENGTVWVRFYHRPSDGRARVLFIASKTTMYCSPLVSLKIVRDKSCLKLCRVFKDGRHITYRLWANLNFATFERMCLFYSTFVAMKRQDSSEPLDPALIDQDELKEDCPFGGKIRDQEMLHALKILRDETSGVIRIEASPLRGPMMDVPLWTAFITTYKIKNDQDWAHHLGNGLVSLVALKPAPYIFLHGYEPRHRGKEWLLQFLDTKDAKDFISTWVGLCRRSD